ncbi:MAG: hypothetical protein E7Z70_02090 [Thermoplasmata archaeon]|nr:hypothetical protein [Thermoplasmata archaeon]
MWGRIETAVDYWHPTDDPHIPYLITYAAEVELPHGHYFDYEAAEEPEDARLPMSYWSKERILEYCLQSSKVSSGACEILARMRFDDLRSFALMRFYSSMTGSLSDPSKNRHTEFYGLDIDNIASLGV